MNETMILPIILEERCTGCGDCVEACPTGALELRGRRAVLARPEDCRYCADCETICPQGAIALPFEIVFGDEIPG
ncbi:MAG: ATP-binding protein [Chloroflexia bacterium]